MEAALEKTPSMLLGMWQNNSEEKLDSFSSVTRMKLTKVYISAQIKIKFPSSLLQY